MFLSASISFYASISANQRFYQRKSASTLLSEVRPKKDDVGCGSCAKVPVGVVAVIGAGAVSGYDF